MTTAIIATAIWLAVGLAVGIAFGKHMHARAVEDHNHVLTTLLHHEAGARRKEVTAVRELFEDIVLSERDRNEHLQRILDQYRSEGIQNPSYHDYGETTPETVKPLPKEAQEWLNGLDPDIREEYEGLIRHRLESGEQVVDVLISLSTLA